MITFGAKWRLIRIYNKHNSNVKNKQNHYAFFVAYITLFEVPLDILNS